MADATINVRMNVQRRPVKIDGHQYFTFGWWHGFAVVDGCLYAVIEYPDGRVGTELLKGGSGGVRQMQFTDTKEDAHDP